MYKQEFFLQTSEATGEIYRGLTQTAQSAQFDRMTAAIAYTTVAGCRLLAEAFESGVVRWRTMEKRWLISVDYGFTEPRALQYLADLPNSRVHVANAEAVLDANLRPKTRFHNKLYFFDNDDNNAIAVFSGSANLTVSGLFENNEQASASVWTPPVIESDRAYFDHMRRQRDALKHTFAAETLLDDDLLDRYRTHWRPTTSMPEDRTQLVEKTTEPAPEFPLPKAVAIAAASSFWAEVGQYVVPNLGPGRPGNQIDLQRGCRVFFGFGAGEVPRNTMFGSVLIRYAGELIDCHMRFANNYMDRLNMPIPDDPGPPTYAGQTLLFERNADGTFDLHVGSPEEIANWKERSRDQATLYRLQSGREYGVFT